MWLTEEQQSPQKQEVISAEFKPAFSPAFSRQSKTDLNPFCERRDMQWWSFKNMFGCLCTERTHHSNATHPPLALLHPARIWFPSDCSALSSKSLCVSPLLWWPFSSAVRQPRTQLLQLALGTAVLVSSNQHKSTVWGSTITASTALPGTLNSHPRL